MQISDLMYTIPTIPHLQSLKLAVMYRELPEDENHHLVFKAPQKWKQDPDGHRYGGFAPRNKYYICGELVDEQKPSFSATSRTPFPEKRVPRRGLLQVYSNDPDYARLCKEQGLEHLLNGSMSPASPNGTHPFAALRSNGHQAPQVQPEALNGAHPVLSVTGLVDSTQVRPFVNGVNGISSNGGD